MIILLSADFFSKLTFFKKFFQEHFQSVQRLYPNQDEHSVWPDLGHNCLHDKIHCWRVKSSRYLTPVSCQS